MSLIEFQMKFKELQMNFSYLWIQNVPHRKNVIRPHDLFGIDLDKSHTH